MLLRQPAPKTVSQQSLRIAVLFWASAADSLSEIAVPQLYVEIGQSLNRRSITAQWTSSLDSAHRGLKPARHLRSERVSCLADGLPITRDRVIKAALACNVWRLCRASVHILRHTCCSHLSMRGALARRSLRDPIAGG